MPRALGENLQKPHVQDPGTALVENQGAAAMIPWHRTHSIMSKDSRLNCQKSFASVLAPNENPSATQLPQRGSVNNRAASLWAPENPAKTGR